MSDRQAAAAAGDWSRVLHSCDQPSIRVERSHATSSQSCFAAMLTSAMNVDAHQARRLLWVPSSAHAKASSVVTQDPHIETRGEVMRNLDWKASASAAAMLALIGCTATQQATPPPN